MPLVQIHLVEGRDPLVFAAFASEILDNQALAAALGATAARQAQRYQWSLSAARLRRLYSDLTARTLTSCR